MVSAVDPAARRRRARWCTRATSSLSTPGASTAPVSCSPSTGLSLDHAVTTYDYSTPGDPRRLSAYPPRAEVAPRWRRGLPRRRRHPARRRRSPRRAGATRGDGVGGAVGRGQPRVDALRDLDLLPGRAGRPHALHERLRGARHGDPAGAARGRPPGPGAHDVRRHRRGDRRGRRRAGAPDLAGGVRLPRRDRPRAPARPGAGRGLRRRCPGRRALPVRRAAARRSSSSRSSPRRSCRDAC